MIDEGLRVAVALFGFLVVITSYGIYTAFGPPSKELEDTFEKHED